MEKLVTDVAPNPTAFQKSFEDTVIAPPALCANFVHPDKAEAAASHTSRFPPKSHKQM